MVITEQEIKDTKEYWESKHPLLKFNSEEQEYAFWSDITMYYKVGGVNIIDSLINAAIRPNKEEFERQLLEFTEQLGTKKTPPLQ